MFYNSSIPPEYELDKVTAPLHLFHAMDDLYASVEVENCFYHSACSLIKQYFF